jgi:glucose/arabinose dehydrogenase
MSGYRKRGRFVGIACLGLAAIALKSWTCDLAIAQTINPTYSDGLTIAKIAPSLQNIAQMALSPDASHLFVASYEYGIVQYDFAIGANGVPILSNPADVWRNAPPGDQGIRGSLGLAFHQDPVLGTVLYFSQAVPNVGGYPASVTAETGRLQTVRRITDTNGDGVWGGEGDVNQAILNNIQVNTEHQVDNFAIRGNSLFMGIGTQTIVGNNEAAYNGTISWIEDLTQLSGDTDTENLAGFDTPAGNGQGADGWHLDTRPFTSTDTGKLRVYSTGARNPFGLTIEGADRDGDVWFSMNQKEEQTQGGVLPDELHHTFQYADHGFPKWYQTDGEMRNALEIGPTPPNTAPEQAADVDVQLDPLDDNITNWKTDPTATGAGYFDPDNSVTPIATFGIHASADGLDFYYGNNQTFNGDIFISRFSYGDVVSVDPVTGEVASVVSGMQFPLAVLRVPGGLLLSDYQGISYLGFHGDMGDFNDDGSVNAADYTVWRDSFGQMVEPGEGADADRDGMVTMLDYEIWKSDFGYPEMNGAAARNVTVPGPSCWIHLSALALGLAILQRRSTMFATVAR